jgi:hypothetical protein
MYRTRSRPGIRQDEAASRGHRRASALTVRACLGACLALASFACGDEFPAPRLFLLEPGQGYNDQPTRVVLTGAGFVPGLELDLASGQRQLDPSGFTGFVGRDLVRAELLEGTWIDSTRLSALVAPGLPDSPLPYDVTLIDPRGARVVLPQGFLSAGPDLYPPLVEIASPRIDRPLAPGARFDLDFSARDPRPGALRALAWSTRNNGLVLESGSCAVNPTAGSDTHCRTAIQISDTLMVNDLFEIEVTATDASSLGNRKQMLLSFRLEPRPVLAAFRPPAGTSLGGTEVVIKGEHFVAGTVVLIGGAPLVPAGGVLVGSQTITGRTEPGPPGPAEVKVVAPTGEVRSTVDFVYLAAPHIDRVVPETVAAAGGTPVQVLGGGFTAATRVYLGTRVSDAVLLVRQEVKSSTLIEGTAPPGKGVTSVWVADPERGSATWTAGRFTWL